MALGNQDLSCPCIILNTYGDLTPNSRAISVGDLPVSLSLFVITVPKVTFMGIILKQGLINVKEKMYFRDKIFRNL